MKVKYLSNTPKTYKEIILESEELSILSEEYHSKSPLLKSKIIINLPLEIKNNL